MSTGTAPPSLPPFNMSHYPSDESDRGNGGRNFQLSRDLSSDDGHATVNLPQGSNHSIHQQLGHESMGFNGPTNSSNNHMSNSVPSLGSNGFISGPGGNGSIGRPAYDQTSRLRQNFNAARSSSPLSRPPLFSPSLLHEVERSHQQVRSPSGSHPASSPPPRSNLTSPRYFTEPTHSSNSHQHFPHSHPQQTHHPASQQQHQQLHQHPSHQSSQPYAPNSQQHPSSHLPGQNGHQQQQQQQQQHNWPTRNGGMGPLDFPTSVHTSSLNPADRPHSSMSERSSRMGPGTAQSPVGGLNKESEFSIFVGDLSPDLREEDLVAQFQQPPAWPPSHPFASALIHAQQTQGVYQPGAHIGPAPFHSTKSAKIMTDPVTGASKGYGFVRFALEADCNRALVEMQGVVVSPANGLSPGRPLRVSTATPKNRGTAPPPGPNMPGDPNLQHLQMPRPHNAAQNANASFLYGGAAGAPLSGGSRSEAVSPQPHARQQSSPSNPASLVSPVSPVTPYDGPGGANMAASFGPLYGGFPSSSVDGTRDSSPAGMLRSHTPTSAAPAHQQGGGGGGGSGNPGDSAADPNNTTVFVGGLSSLISESTLRRYFEHFGEITYVKIPPGKGCGFVQYVRKQDAENAIQRMNGFPILNSKIRLSWGRSQGDKAAAAAAQTMAQYAQLGQLAGLAGLSTLSPSQLAQLAGLGSALSAAQAQAQAQVHGQQRGPPGFGGVGGNAGLANDPLSTLARQLAAANMGGPVGLNNSQGLPGMGQRAPLPSFLQQQQLPPSHHQQHQGLGHHNHQQQHQQPFRGGQPGGFPSSQNTGLPGGMGPNGSAGGNGGYGGGSSSHSNHPFDFDQRTSDFGNLGQDGQSRSRGAFPPHQQQVEAGTGMAQMSQSDLIDAFANLDFDESTRAALAQRMQAMQGASDQGQSQQQHSAGTGRNDPFATSGYNRDPNAFMFSPFSPADSPIVGGKADLPNPRSSSSSLHLSQLTKGQEEDGTAAASGAHDSSA